MKIIRSWSRLEVLSAKEPKSPPSYHRTPIAISPLLKNTASDNKPTNLEAGEDFDIDGDPALGGKKTSALDVYGHAGAESSISGLLLSVTQTLCRAQTLPGNCTHLSNPDDQRPVREVRRGSMSAADRKRKRKSPDVGAALTPFREEILKLPTAPRSQEEPSLRGVPETPRRPLSSVSPCLPCRTSCMQWLCHHRQSQ